MHKFTKVSSKTLILLFPFLISLVSISGCGASREEKALNRESRQDFSSNSTIGSLVNVVYLDAIPVEGIALVGGLEGTGSAQCPPEARRYLEKYIMGKLGTEGNISQYITSKNTAPVRVEGLMPTVKTRNGKFDLKVTALENTQTTSLNGGRLWGVDLYERGNIGNSLRLLAKGQGPMYIDRLNQDEEIDYLSGYVLGAGESRNEYKMLLFIKEPNYRTAAVIRDRLNTRFESDTAKAESPSTIRITVPDYYKKQKERFASIIESIYMIDSEELNKERVSKFTRLLISGKQKQASENALEAIGSPAEKKLEVLLNSSNPEVRLRAGRCLLNLGNQQGLKELRELAFEKGGDYRLEALKAISKAADREQITSVARQLLSAEQQDLQLTAYEILADIDDIYIDRQRVSRNVILDRITRSDKKLIYVYRKSRPRIVIFGAPLVCDKDIYAETSDGKVTINAPQDAEEVTIFRKIPGKPREGPIKLTCSFELADIIKTLSNPPIADKRAIRRPGLGITYDQTIELLKKLAKSSVLDVEFRASELPKIP